MSTSDTAGRPSSSSWYSAARTVVGSAPMAQRISCANAFTDPTHRHYFGYSSFDYFTEGHGLCFYNYARFQRRTARLIFYPTILSNDCLAPSESFSGGLRTPLGMDFPAWYLQFELEVVK